jgi:hypothetical protein
MVEIDVEFAIDRRETFLGLDIVLAVAKSCRVWVDRSEFLQPPVDPGRKLGIEFSLDKGSKLIGESQASAP